MPFRELVVVDCTNCERELENERGTELGLFRSHSAASRAATRAGWYVDASVVFCAVCYDFGLRWFNGEEELEPNLDELSDDELLDLAFERQRERVARERELAQQMTDEDNEQFAEMEARRREFARAAHRVGVLPKFQGERLDDDTALELRAAFGFTAGE